MQMLQGDFFFIRSIQKEAASAKMMLELKASHAIFAGHFPGQPIVPGACLLQMVKEIMETALDKKLQLIKAHQLKFMSPIDPNKSKELQAVFTFNTTENGEVNVAATFMHEGVVCFKCNGVFTIYDSNKIPY
ncbi:MAG: 3-hydroxyacyl-ACP dehydratase [Sediminibacterium sp.]|nr:3-hydroxyacyl-ACP dehydratase [Sediminibacterium sp.]